jgi:psiF repeat
MVAKERCRFLRPAEEVRFQYPGAASKTRSLPKEPTVRRTVFLAAIGLLTSNLALAANPACEAQATEKKLSSAAKNSFVTKCEKDATAAATKTCDAQATEKNLSGAARTSFTKKCVGDATGAVE